MNLNSPNRKPLQQTGPKQTGKYLLYALSAMIPAIIAAYWPLYWLYPDETVLVLRPAIFLVGFLAALICGHYHVSRTETRLAQVLGLFCALWLGTSFGATDMDVALQDWIKLCIVCLIALFAARFLRNKHLSIGFGYSLIATSILIGMFIVYGYFRFRGVVMPTYESARQFKALAERIGIPLNTIPFASVLSYMMGMCLVKSNRWLWTIGVVLFVIASVFTGSRTPLALLVLSAASLLILNGLQNRHTAIRFTSWVVLVVSLVSAPFVIASFSFKTMSDITEGRWDLWYVAIHKFSQKPWIGYGYESAHDDLSSLLPGVYNFRTGHEFLGGYHNEYLTVLAEQGLIGFVAVIVLSWFLFRRSWQLAFCKWRTWRNRQWILFTTLSIMIRAGVEVPGLFGNAREPVDFLAFLFVGLLVSRFAIEEDCARRAVESSSLKLPHLKGELLAA